MGAPYRIRPCAYDAHGVFAFDLFCRETKEKVATAYRNGCSCGKGWSATSAAGESMNLGPYTPHTKKGAAAAAWAIARGAP